MTSELQAERKFFAPLRMTQPIILNGVEGLGLVG
jgi:hypothetical protein